MTTIYYLEHSLNLCKLKQIVGKRAMGYFKMSTSGCNRRKDKESRNKNMKKKCKYFLKQTLLRVEWSEVLFEDGWRTLKSVHLCRLL